MNTFNATRPADTTPVTPGHPKVSTLPVESANKLLIKGDDESLKSIKQFVNDTFNNGSPDMDDIGTLLDYQRLAEIGEKVNSASDVNDYSEIYGLLGQAIATSESLGEAELVEHYNNLREFYGEKDYSERHAIRVQMTTEAPEIAPSDLPIEAGNQALVENRFDDIIEYANNRTGGDADKYKKLSIRDQKVLEIFKQVATLEKLAKADDSDPVTVKTMIATAAVVFDFLKGAGVEGAREMADHYFDMLDPELKKEIQEVRESFIRNGDLVTLIGYSRESDMSIARESFFEAVDIVEGLFESPDQPDISTKPAEDKTTTYSTAHNMVEALVKFQGIGAGSI